MKLLNEIGRHIYLFRLDPNALGENKELMYAATLHSRFKESHEYEVYERTADVVAARGMEQMSTEDEAIAHMQAGYNDEPSSV